jgi:hypothetical protein
VSSEIRGNIEEALSYYEEGLDLLLHLHDVIHSCVGLALAAGARVSFGDKAAAHRYFDELQRLASQTSNRWALGMLLQFSGFNVQNNYRLYEAAKLSYQGSLLLWREIQRLESGFGIVRGLMGLAEIAAIQGDGRRCGWLLGAADRLTPSSGSHREALDERVAQAYRRLDPATAAMFKTGWPEGRAATLEQAIDEALQESAAPNDASASQHPFA